MKSRVLITGAAGFVGANLARRLIKEDYEIHVLTRKNSNKYRLKEIETQINEHQGNLIEKETLELIVDKIKPEIIFHLATKGIYGGIQDSDEELIKTNIQGTKNLIEACDGFKYKCFINTGSSSEYGTKNAPMKEDDVCTPNTIYGITKNTSTQIGQLVAKNKDKPILSFRLFSPFGPFDSKERLIPRVISRALINQDIYLSAPTIGRDFIFIDDVVELYIRAIEKAEEYKGEIFNVASGIQSTVLNVVEEVIKITDSKSRLHWGEYKERAYDNSHWLADMTKTKKYFDWKPQYNLKQGLEKTIDWIKSQNQIYL